MGQFFSKKKKASKQEEFVTPSERRRSSKSIGHDEGSKIQKQQGQKVFRTISVNPSQSTNQDRNRIFSRGCGQDDDRRQEEFTGNCSP